MGASYIYDISRLRVKSFECMKMHGLTNPKFKINGTVSSQIQKHAYLLLLYQKRHDCYYI